MHRIAVALACLACVGQARQLQSGPAADTRKRAVAQLLLGHNTAAAFNPSASGGRGIPVARTALATSSPFVSNQLSRGNPTMNFFKNLGVPAQQTSQVSKVKEVEKEELSIQDLLTQYGVIALGFHFTVWITCLTSIYLLLSLGVDLSKLFELIGLGDKLDANAAGVAGRIAATLGIVEVIGPARLVLTVSATPKVSEAARQYQVVRDFEEAVEEKWNELSQLFKK